jgi:hypothetical protein
MTQLRLFGGQNHLAPQKIVPPRSLGPSKDFATKINPKIMAELANPISYMKQACMVFCWPKLLFFWKSTKPSWSRGKIQ